MRHHAHAYLDTVMRKRKNNFNARMMPSKRRKNLANKRFIWAVLLLLFLFFLAAIFWMKKSLLEDKSFFGRDMIESLIADDEELYLKNKEKIDSNRYEQKENNDSVDLNLNTEKVIEYDESDRDYLNKLIIGK